MKNHTQLLNEVLKRVPALPASVLRVASLDPDSGQLATIAARFDTPGDVLETLAREHTSKGDVANALNLRPAVPGTQRSYRPETRARVLAAALRSQPHDPDVFRDAFAAFTARRTETLLEALIGMPATRFTPEQALLLLRQAGHSWEKSARPGGTISKLVDRLTPALAVELLVEHRRWAYIELVLAHPLPQDRQLEVIDMLLDSARWTTNSDLTRVLRAVNTALAHLPVSERDELGAAICRHTAARARRVVEQVTAAVEAAKEALELPAQSWDTRPAENYELPDELEEFDGDRLAAMAATSDVDLLTSVVDAALASGAPSKILAVSQVALHNRALRTPQLLGLLREIPEALRENRGATFLCTADVVGIFGHVDPAVTPAWIELVPEQVLELHGWEPFGGPDAGPATIAKWVRGDDHRTLRQCVSALGRRRLTPDELLELPLKDLRSVLNRGPDVFSAVNAETVAHLIGQATATSQQWAAYDVVLKALPDDVTLGELLSTTNGVVA